MTTGFSQVNDRIWTRHVFFYSSELIKDKCLKRRARKKTQREEILRISSFSRILFSKNNIADNWREKGETTNFHKYTKTNINRDIFFLSSFSSPKAAAENKRKTTATIDKEYKKEIIIFVSCANNYQTFGLKEKRRENKQTNKRERKCNTFLSGYIYICKANSEWTIAHSSNLLHSLTHAEKEKHIIL